MQNEFTMEEEKETHTPSETRKSRKALIIAGVALALVLAVAYYIHAQGYESTDNAFLEGRIVQVSPRVSGQMLRVLVEDNQHVNKGDLLAEIDPADYQARLAESQARLGDAAARLDGAQVNVALTSTVSGAILTQADAGLAGARDQVEVLRANLAQNEAAVAAAAAALEQAQARETAAAAEAERAASDAVRYRTLYQKDEVSRQMLDRAQTDARATAANRNAAAQAVTAARAQWVQAKAGRESTEASLRQVEKMVNQAQGRQREASTAPQQIQLRQADFASAGARRTESEAAVQQAQLNLSYTKIYASESGYITRKSVEPGNFVGAGQALMALVADRMWVIANFKETQITHMRPGQNVTVKVDAYPQLKLRGHVDSLQSGTGARFSLMPPENATGNYVKVVQRVPVKIVLIEPPPAGYRLGPGMSVEPEVEVR
jgi:membrane fusion protein, multidrug efflux system